MTAHKVALIEFYAFNFGAIMAPNGDNDSHGYRNWYTDTNTLTRIHIQPDTHCERDISTWQAQKPIKLICQTLKRRLSTFMFTNPWHICANGYILPIPDGSSDRVCICVCVSASVSVCQAAIIKVFCLTASATREGSVQKGLRATKCVARQKVKAAKGAPGPTSTASRIPSQKSYTRTASLQERWSIKWH